MATTNGSGSRWDLANSIRQVLSVGVFAIAASSSLTAVAAINIDQQQDAVGTPAGALNADIYGSAGLTSFGQTFQQSNNNIAGAGLYLQEGCSSGSTLTISIYNGDPTSIGTVIASGSTTMGAATNYDIYWTPVPVIPGQTYWMSVDMGGATWVAAQVVASATYSLGDSFAVDDTNTLLAAYTGFGGPLVPGDLRFRTYYDDEYVVQVKPVPALGGIGVLMTSLLLGGVGAVTSWRRRKRPE